MSLMKQITQDQIEARKTKDAVTASLLTTLLGEAGMIGKNAGNRETTDAEAVAVIKKFVKNIDETITALGSKDTSIQQNEKIILEKYLPKQLSEDQLKQIASTVSSMPDFMKLLKQQYVGQYDGKLASTIAKQVF